MSLLIFFICLSICVSFLCSLLEAIILSVTPSYLASLRNAKPQLYGRVRNLKDDIEKPLASILTFNTVAHTIGAAGAGAEAQRLFGSNVLALFSALLTFAILFFSEIIPKSIGAGSWKTLLPFAARTLPPMIFIAYPLVWLSEVVSSLFKSKRETVSREEIVAMAKIGLDDGAIDPSEHQALKSLIQFEKVKATDIFTPSENVKSIKEYMTLHEAYECIQLHPFSRIIVTGKNSSDVRGYILRTKLQHAHINQSAQRVNELTMPLVKVSENVSLPRLFKLLLTRREHICAIVNDRGDFLGLLTLEDLIEHMLDLEIYDEQDHLAP